METFEHSHRRLEPSVQSSPSTMGIQTHPAGFQRGVLQSPNLPALWFQSAANSSQREKGWRTISRNKLLPEQLDIKAKIQCAWETVWVSINLAYDLGKNERTLKYCNSSSVKQGTSASGRGSFNVLRWKGNIVLPFPVKPLAQGTMYRQTSQEAFSSPGLWRKSQMPSPSAQGLSARRHSMMCPSSGSSTVSYSWG